MCIDVNEYIPCDPKTYHRRANRVMKKEVFPDTECMLCGNSYKKRLIHTHHIDSDITNNEPYNLIRLCIDCHESVHGHSVMRC